MVLRTSHYTNLLRIGVPIMMGQMSIIMMRLADTLMVGRYDTNELAASSYYQGADVQGQTRKATTLNDEI